MYSEVQRDKHHAHTHTIKFHKHSYAQLTDNVESTNFFHSCIVATQTI